MRQFGELEAVIMHRLWTWDRRFALIPLLPALPGRGGARAGPGPADVTRAPL